MNDISPTSPEPASDPTPDPAEAITSASDVSVPTDTPTELPHNPSSFTGPGIGHRLLITLLFLALGLGGGAVAWRLQTRFTLVSTPLAPTGNAGDAHPDPDISLYGLEYVIQALGIPPKHSSFHVLPEPSSGSQSSGSTSPNTAVELANIERELERRKLDITPRRNRAAVYLLLLGIPLGAALGLAEGIRRRSFVMLFGSTLASAVLAGAAGFLGGALHARVANAMAGKDLDIYVTLMTPQFVAWFVLAVGLIAWPLAMNLNYKTGQNLITSAIAAALLCSLIYVPAAQTIFFDDPLSYSLPGHIYSFLFWYLFGSGMLSLVIGNACANIRYQPLPSAT